ncbi:hypothetical protein [Plantibacter sp. Leaf314]|uniref:hypothetical protein n=1 Tax=Plantibacter sp. Leaf314 TaxID=1736333 RepID=UPI000B08697B|nr:hypothetical protein [Plantibacter sp. Leaf314]
MTFSRLVTTTSGIEVVVTIAREAGVVTAYADAIPSPLTRQYDEIYSRASQDYLAAAATHGPSRAGDPPLTGAEKYLAEIRIALSELPADGADPGIRYLGGDGTEWRSVWKWSLQPTPTRFEIRTPLGVSPIDLSTPN